ncbi:ankyrin repeat domain-containing protein [Legionella micdadei]|uniref:Ankyrin repeat-containing protein n=1 Tax=Legionella micdadei TaxID=451 RepID=A0A098GIB6_LEGMI|nr:ankyrin repeat domain-containing protein [Legionella micdadei]KTD28202.1 Ankyrin repeat protein [Legionella micdadei]NSL16831.1 ankyrin repeat domain-containing protein [Legionella micdadei]CEG61211.1 protein of unknown function [ankyrin repeat] [Legionella micdadei]SCY32982.1 Ankyrin repeat-containing protein [Legionella micdadei]
MTQPIEVLNQKIDRRLAHLKKIRGHSGAIQHQAESIVFHYYLKQLIQHKPSQEQTRLIRRITDESRLISEIKPYFRLFTILELAIKEDDLELLEAVIDADPKIVDYVFTDEQSKKTALVMAAEQNRTALVELLVRVGSLNFSNSYTRKALNAAIFNGNIAIVQTLLAAGVVPTQADFQRACSQGQLEIAKMLHTASPQPFDYNSALLSSAAAGNLPAVHYLVDGLNASVNYQEPPAFRSSKHELTPLIVAIQYKKPEVAEYLISRGAHVRQAQDALGLSTIGLAAFLGNAEVIQEQLSLNEKGFEEVDDNAIELNFNLDSADNEGYTPLIRAVQNGNLGIIDSLIAAGANVNAQSKNGHTALIEAVMKGAPEVVAALLKIEHLDVNAREKEKGLSAREIALRSKNTVIVEAIDSFVANRNLKENLVHMRENKLYELIKIIDTYHEQRKAQKDENGKIKEYLHINIFGLFQKSYTQKHSAINALKSVLKGDYFDKEGNPIDLNTHLSTLRKGSLGENLRAFIKAGHANCIVNRPVNTVSDFVKALQESTPQLSSTLEIT